MRDTFEGIYNDDNVSFTYATSENPRDFNERADFVSLDWDNHNYFLGDYAVLPYGSNNDLPSVIKDVVKNNYIAPGLLNRKTELLWGLGPRLYTEEIKDNRVIRTWVDDKIILAWLESFDYEKYLLACSEDYQHIQGTFTKVVLNKGSRIGQPFINRLEHEQPDRARLAMPKTQLPKRKPTHCIINDWSLSHISSIEDPKVYPLFDYKDPFAKPLSVFYSSKYTFCTDYYTIPDIYGSLEWLRRSSAVPLIFKALSQNGINIKYHVISPGEYWRKKRDMMIENCNKTGIVFEESMFATYQNNFLKEIGRVLAGISNTGKFLHTVKELTVEGNNLLEHGWEVKVIDQKIKDFVEAQIAISQRADRAVASGISLHSALGNMSETGKVDSGSEQHYALISYLNTGIDIQEMIITKPLNCAIKANWPNKNLKIGFFHNVPEKQSDVSPQDRSKNSAPPKES